MFEGRRDTWAIAGNWGGMNCVGGAAVRYWLAEQGHPHPDIEVDISGNIPNAAYAMADQHYLGMKIWAEDLPLDPEFIRWDREGEILSVDRMVDHHFTKLRPLDEGAFARSNTKFFFATTHVRSKKTKYFTNEDVLQRGVEVREIIRAGTALVGMTRHRPVKIGDDLFSDGATSTDLNDCIQVALDAGAKFVVAIDSSPPVQREEFLKKFPSSGWTDKVALLQPDFNAEMVTNDPEVLKRSFYASFRAASEHPLLREFFGDLVTSPRRTAL